MSAIEDPMELSSDMDRRQMADEDIDIDLDLTGDQLLDGEDDYMAEDVNPAIDEASFDRQLAQGGRDDEMLDDEYSLQEAEEISSVHDEDLGDAVYPVLEEPVESLEEPSSEQHLEHTAEWPSDTFQGQEVGVTVNEKHPQPHSRSDHSESQTAPLSQPPVEPILDPLNAIQENDDFEAEEPLHHLDSIHNLSSEVNPAELKTGTAKVTQNTDSDQGSTSPKDEDEGQTHSPDPEDKIATSDGYETRNEIPSAIATYTHPVTVVYQDSEMSLFPPTDEDQEHSQTYLLHDERLANESIMNLFGACRLVLADSIEEDDELEITIGELSLQISESATECTSTTLAQIIDLYVQLQKHDGVDNPAPMYLALSTKVKFSHRFGYLLSAVAEGKGLSQLMLLESVEEGDQHSDNQSRQEDAQGSYPQTPKPVSGVDLGVDSPGDVDADENDEEEPNLTYQQLEDLTPGPQDYEVGDQTNIPPAEEHVIANHASQTEGNQTRTGSSNTLDGGPNNIHQAEDPINGPSLSDMNSIPIANKDQITEGERDLIYFEDEDNPGSSTGSSTVQGDVREVTVDSAHPVFRERTSSTKEKDVTATRRDLESDSTAVLIGGSSAPPFLTDTIEDDYDYAAHTEITEERPRDDAVHEGDEKLEDELEHHPKTSSAVDLPGYGQDPKEFRNSSNGPEQESNDSAESRFDEDPNSSYTLIDSNIGTNIPRTELIESDVQRSAGSESLVPEFDGASIIKHRHTTFDSSEYVYSNTTDSLEGDQDPAPVGLTAQYADRALYESTSQDLRSTSDAQEQLADSDEITYEDDDNEPEPSKVYGFEQKPNSSPGLLKRMRSDHEDHDEIDSSIQDAKRHRPG